MAGRDYILCRDCGDKLIYDGSDNVRSGLEEIYGDPSACNWTVKLVCPPCLKKIEDQQAEPVDVKALAAKAGLPLAWISETGVIQWSQLERLIALAQQAEPVAPAHKRVIEGDNDQSMSGNPSY